MHKKTAFFEKKSPTGLKNVTIWIPLTTWTFCFITLKVKELVLETHTCPYLEWFEVSSFLQEVCHQVVCSSSLQLLITFLDLQPSFELDLFVSTRLVKHKNKTCLTKGFSIKATIYPVSDYIYLTDQCYV